jgi:hypothetical protein
MKVEEDGGMKVEEARRLKELEDENRRLKQIVANQTLDIEMLKHINQGHWRALLENGPPCISCSQGSESRRVERVA